MKILITDSDPFVKDWIENQIKFISKTNDLREILLEKLNNLVKDTFTRKKENWEQMETFLKVKGFSLEDIKHLKMLDNGIASMTEQEAEQDRISSSLPTLAKEMILK